METKINQIDKFLDKDYKVKISLRLLKEKSFISEMAIKILDEFANSFEEKAKIEKKYGKDNYKKYVMLSLKK